jgi:hypothetical protein
MRPAVRDTRYNVDLRPEEIAGITFVLMRPAVRDTRYYVVLRPEEIAGITCFFYENSSERYPV